MKECFLRMERVVYVVHNVMRHIMVEGIVENYAVYFIICCYLMLCRSAADCYGYISNRITLLIRQVLKRYYDYWLVCDDYTCGR